VARAAVELLECPVAATGATPTLIELLERSRLPETID
jgi:hypothetical protein